MTTLERLTMTIAIIIALIVVAFCIGQETEKQKSLKAAITAFENSHEVENEVEALTPYQRCLAVGGVPYDCRVLLRGLDKTAQGK
ncbi:MULTISPECIES: hypothetical protein [Bartonella]|uniref:hypothetical protein n=1 Tax=Bartonella TaxID=773 RepID=UPI0018DB8DDB|nr:MULTISPECIES: hypothetical protein [Bartonella]MBI0168589.1 hypothetical protein [Bartonella sp. W8167]MBI0175420.1 hypothetical protein [Bartonella apis]